MALLLPLLAVLGCRDSLDVVPIVEGPHCAEPIIGYVVETLDGDTLHVVSPFPQNLGGLEDPSAGDGSIGNDDPDRSATFQRYTVRMLGVDAPEIAHGDGEVADCYGDEAADWLADALTGREVVLTFDQECTDAYDRALAYVFLTNDASNHDVSTCWEESCTLNDSTVVSAEVLMNDILLRYGYARVYEDFDDIRLAELFYDSQDVAQSENRGLWATCE